MGFMEFLSGLGSGAQLRKLQKVADQVNSIEEDFRAMSDAELRGETDTFRARIADGESLGEFIRWIGGEQDVLGLDQSLAGKTRLVAIVETARFRFGRLRHRYLPG